VKFISTHLTTLDDDIAEGHSVHPTVTLVSHA